MVSEKSVREALSRVIDDDTGRDVMSSGLISGVAVRGGRVGFIITVDPQSAKNKAMLREACETEVMKLPGVEAVTAVLTAESPALVAGSGADYPQTPPSGGDRQRAVWNTTPVENVKRIIAIASGKGGVGKSTVAVNLALALRNIGHHVGLLDADIYGPSIPRMMALSGQPEIKDGKMMPLESHGIKCMSMGFITGEEAAILRGPMISKTLHQMLRSSHWGKDAPLDMLLVDMPPGTGDIHLSMAQQAPLAGAIIVTTPQEVAVIDARKALKMFQKVNVPVLGVIENMSGSIFGSGGGKRLAQEFGVPFLGDIPLDAEIVKASDSGKAYNGAQARAFKTIAEKLR